MLVSWHLAACGVQPDMLVAGFLAGFRVEFSEFCAIADTYNRQFTFTGVTGVSKFGTYSTAAVLEY